MTVLSAVQRAAPWIGITVPSVLFTATDRTSVEMQALVNDCARAIADDYDWQRFRKVATITGDGATTTFDLPTDFRRMVKTAQLWPSDEPNSPLIHIQDSNEWLREEVQDFQTITDRWTLYGGQVHIKPAPTSGVTIKYFYISSLLVLATGGSVPTKAEFTEDTDTLAVDERLLQLSIIWRWKAQKGRPYAEDMGDYTRSIEQVAANDKGARILKVGRPRLPGDVRLAWPGVITP